MFLEWIKEREEHQRAFENGPEMTGLFLKQLKGRRWNIIRKIRLVRLIRRLIEEGIISGGVKEIYEEGCRILSKMERGRDTSEEGEEEEEEEEEEGEEEEKERYMCELYLLKVRGEQKKLKENEVLLLRREIDVLRREVEEFRKKMEEEKTRAYAEKKRADEEERKREEAEQGREEEKNRAQEEKRLKEEAERREAEEKRKREESEKGRAEERRKREEREAEKRKMEEEMKAKKEEDEQWIKNGGTRMNLMKSLDEMLVEFGDESVMRKENNSIIHNNEPRWVSGFIGRKLDNSVHRMFE